MVRIAPINLYYNPKTLWFDPRDLDIKKDDPVVVLTARGVEFGRAAADVFEADENQVKKLKTALKPVKRIASDEDVEKAAEMERRSAEALPVFREMAAEANEDMHPVSVEYLLDGDKAVFYFEAEERVDFRELVRKLAARFHVRIDMRQIGVRDEARMVGGLGHCGQELCCKRMGGEFCPVSIRMAKEQDLSLNPQKISGVCGRLMCCLRYEYDAYKDFKSRAPKQNATIATPDGPAKVVDLDVPREIVSLQLEGEKPVKIPLADFDEPDEGTRPRSVGKEAWNHANSQASMVLGAEGSFLTSQFTGSDKLADPSTVNRRSSSGRSPASGGRNGAKDARRGQNEAAPSEGRKPRRRRSTKVGTDAPAAENSEATPRKRRNGSGQSGQQGKQQAAPATEGKQSGSASSSPKKRSGAKKQQSSQRTGSNDSAPKRAAQGQQKQRGQQSPKNASDQKQGPRPGQKSSGLRQARRSSSDAGQTNGTDQVSAPTQNREDGGHRRARRRTHKAGGDQGKTAPEGTGDASA